MDGAPRTLRVDRTDSPSAQVVTLPSAAINQEFRFDDLAGNFNAYPVTLSPPGGQTIAGLGDWVLNVNRGSWSVKYYGSNIWGVARCAS